MSEVTSHRASARGRGVSRGGRGGGAIGRGGRNGASSRSNGDTFDSSKTDDVPLEEQGELGQLKLKYATELALLKDMFPGWTDEDLINPLQESYGDVQMAATLISEGHATQWSDVKKKAKERPKSKAPTASATEEGSRGSRGGFKGGRGGFEGTRGSRGRGGTEHRGSTRGRGGHSAARGGKPTNGNTTSDWPEATANPETPDWTGDAEDKLKDESDSIPDSKGTLTEPALEARKSDSNAPLEKPAVKSVPAEPPKKTWATLFHTPAPPPPPPAPVAVAPKKPESPVKPKVESPPPAPPVVTLPPPQPEPTVSLPPPVPAPTVKKSPIIAPALPEIATPRLPQPELAATPAPTTETPKVIEDPATPEETTTQDEPLPPPPGLEKLTEENLEKIENVAPAPPTSTAASTVATTPLPVNNAPSPIASKALPHIHRHPGSRSGLRRILDQREAVVMPRETASVEKVGLQFGSMGLNGDVDDIEEPEQPEKPETVTQPPQQSPIKPKASLPMPVSTAAANIASIVPQTASVSQPVPVVPEQLQQQPVSMPRHAPGLAAPIQQPSQANPLSSSPSAPQPIQQQQTTAQALSGSLPRQSGFGDQSKFESYGQQQQQQPVTSQQNPVGQSPYGGYQGQTNQQSQNLGASNADPYGNYYSSGDPSRNTAFNTFYNTPYGQQSQSQQQPQSQQAEGASQGRSSSALGGSVGTSLDNAQAGTGPSGTQQQGQQSRFGSSFQGNDGAQPGQAGQQAPQHPSQYPMHPSYYPYYNYISMYGHYNNYPKGFHGYGASPQGYMSPGGYEHSSSPAGYGAFGGPNTQGRESSLNDYGRTGGSQTHLGQQNQHSNVGYGSGGVPDYMSGRQQSQLGGLGSQQQLGLGGGQQGGHSDDALKPYGESKAPTGPSGNPAGAPGRPPSTSGLSGPGGQSQLPQNQSQHQQNPMGGAGYPHHLQGQSQQHNPLMGQGALGNQGAHHNSGYGMYGGFGSYPQYGSQGGNRQQQGWGYGGH
ncbi:hypothetical protein ABW19_dt0210574 [Dactylella cylindrospora]|nr:hypothetical protein ABW19_dt0210574 [Dactylella cylindrospora]